SFAARTRAPTSKCACRCGARPTNACWRWSMARLTLTLLAAVLCGCSASGGVLPSKSGTASNVTAKTTDGAQRRTADDNVGIYLQTLHDLIEGDSVTQIDAFRRAADAASTAPTTTNRLRLALALATPGHPSRHAREAEKATAHIQ